MRAANSKTVFAMTLAATKLLARFSTPAAGTAAARLWFTPWTVALSPRAQEVQDGWVRDAQPVSFPTSVGAVAGLVQGNGPAVLLVHGWGERGASLGGFMEPLARAGHRAVAIDLPGHGRSRGGQTNGLELAAAIREVTELLGGVHAVIAHSMGAFATMIALPDGLRSDTLILIAPTSRLDHALDRFCELLALPPRAADGLRREIERRFGTGVWRHFSGPNLVREVDVPTLVIHDRDDPQAPVDDSKEFVFEWPTAQLIVTDGMGHDRALRNEELRTKILNFVRDPASVSEVVPA